MSHVVPTARVSVTVLFLTLAGSVVAQPVATLQQSVEKAVLTNPEIRASFQNFQSGLEGQKVARGALLPEVNASGWVGKEWRGSAGLSESHDWKRHGYSVELRQLLFDGGATINTVQQYGLEKLADYYDLLATVDSVALEAAMAHIDVQRYREMEQLAAENLALHRSTLDNIRERQESGVGRGVDLEQALGREALAQSNYLVETGNLNDVLQRYRRIVGEPAPELLVDGPDLEAQLPLEPENFIPSLRQNPSLLSKQALTLAAQSGKKAALGDFSPRFELRTGTGKDRSERPTENYRSAQSSNVQVVMNYNLYRGGADSARYRQTAAQAYAAQDVRDYTCRNVQQELAIAWNNIQRLKEQLPFLQAHELSTSKVRVAYLQQFQIGQRSLLDLLDTENEFFDARRALVNAEYDLQQLQYRWLTYSHQLLQALELAQPYSEDVPDEAKRIGLHDELLALCQQPKPDAAQHMDVQMEYEEGLRPPTIQPAENQQSQL